MLTETGLVVALEADALWVQTMRRSTCGGCSAQAGCGHGLLNRVSGGQRGFIRALPGIEGMDKYRVGQQVALSIPEEVILRGSFIAYLMPLLCMLAGAAAAVNWLSGNPDLVAVLGATGGLALGFGLVHWHGIRHRQDLNFQPVLVRAVEAPPQPIKLL
jgi:sigma-E factor negative regulatory protein RseC